MIKMETLITIKEAAVWRKRNVILDRVKLDMLKR